MILALVLAVVLGGPCDALGAGWVNLGHSSSAEPLPFHLFWHRARYSCRDSLRGTVSEPGWEGVAGDPSLLLVGLSAAYTSTPFGTIVPALDVVLPFVTPPQRGYGFTIDVAIGTAGIGIPLFAQVATRHAGTWVLTNAVETWGVES